MSGRDENDPSRATPSGTTAAGSGLSQQNDFGPRWRGQIQIDGTVYTHQVQREVQEQQGADDHGRCTGEVVMAKKLRYATPRTRDGDHPGDELMNLTRTPQALDDDEKAM